MLARDVVREARCVPAENAEPGLGGYVIGLYRRFMDKDAELFLRAMDTLGVKAKRGPGPAKTGEAAPSAPSVTDDGVDFDALMQTQRGPAKLMRDSAKKAPKGSEPAPQEPRTAGVAAALRRPDPRDYEVTGEEIAIFEAALSGNSTEVEARVEEAAKKVSRGVNRASSDLFERCVKRGEIEPDAVLDLHQRQRDEAMRRLKNFLDEAVKERWRLVAIVCGRGLHNPDGQPVLKPFIGQLLGGELRTFIRRFAEAPRSLGGAGTWIAEVRLDMRD